MLLRSFKL